MAKTGEVHTLRVVQFGDERLVRAKAILKRAKAEKLEAVMVIGRSDDGELWAESSLNAGQSLWLLEKLRERILAGNPWSVV
jgi:hypothetical protein